MNDTNVVVEPGHSSGALASVDLSARPVHLLLVTAATIFLAEALVMIIFDFLPIQHDYLEAFLDSLLLSLIIFPALFILVFRPLRRQLDLRVQGEREKGRLIEELQTTLDRVKTLEGIIPICSSCKKIRDDGGFWHQVEAYIGAHSDTLFSHGICPDCEKKLFADLR